MNDPFPCETTVDSVPCDGHATHVYRSAHATRLICDSCATAYRLAAKSARPISIVEFTLLEFIPAREYLRGQVDTMKIERDKAAQAAKDATALAETLRVSRNKAMSETQEAWNRLDKMQQSLARAVVLAKIHQESETLINWWVLWFGVFAMTLGIGAQIIWGGIVGVCVFGGGVFASHMVIYAVVQRWWVRPRLAKLNGSAEGIQ